LVGESPSASSLLEDSWILSRLQATAASVNGSLAEYRYDEAANALYQFFWGDLCDWYLELAKLRMETGETNDIRLQALDVFSSVFESSLRLLSPFMPFITEEIWHAYYDGHPPARSIARMPYPEAEPSSTDPAAESEMALLQSLIVAVRASRKDAGVPERESVPALLRADDPTVFEKNRATIERLGRVSSLQFVTDIADGAARRTAPSFEVAVVYQRPVDLHAERDRLQRELAKLEKEKENSDRQLGNEAFLSKAPPAVVEGLRRRNSELGSLVARLRQSLDALPEG
jgi:valyl-tRNA synthetase